ncbi:DUF4870 domain-containing protein [Thermococcus stetteri]|uniref:DUF4870 domain-containing protein n=1 Tax=Thermococcus stetteri TaxID=49900 RepID=UPI001AEB4199|nr:DUF4870 domain-containing protein [Thermococcus stetteri]MBP1912988.1 putative membrane protein [Thermococcus stetteri]
MEETQPDNPPKKTSLGLDENLEGLLAYLLGWVSGIILLLLEKDSDFVRFHAMQSTIIFLPLWIGIEIFKYIPFLGWILADLLGLIGLIVWIVGMVKAYQGERYKFPIAGDLAEQWLGKVNI